MSNRTSDRLWTRDFALNILTQHFQFASYTSLYTIVPLYVLDRGGEAWQVAVVVGSFGVLALAVRPFAGRWVYRFGARRVAILGGAALAIGGLLYIPLCGVAFSTYCYTPAFSVWLLVPVRMFQGVGMAAAPVATATIAANLAPDRRRGEAMGYMGNSIAVATLYSPALAFWLLTWFGFPAAFMFTASTALLGVLLATRLSSERIGAPADRATIEASFKNVPLISRSAVFPTAVFLSYTFSTGPINSYLPVLAADRGLGNPGVFFTFNALTQLIVMPMAGAVADRLGRSSVIIPGLLITSLSMWVLMSATSQLTLILAGFMAGGGFAMLLPGMQSLIVDRAPPRERSSAFATFQQAWDLGNTGGSFTLGPLAGAVSVAATFGVAGLVNLSGVLGFVVGSWRAPAIVPEKQRVSAAGGDSS